MKKYLILLALILIQSCSSGGGDETTTTQPPPVIVPVAKLSFVNDFNATIIGVNGVSSVGTTEKFTITSTDPNDTTPNRIESGEVGIVEIQECDVFWDLTMLITEVDYDFQDEFMVVFHDMQLFSCDREYTCRVSNIESSPVFTDLVTGDLSCLVNP